jgi:hypothetical protein
MLNYNKQKMRILKSSNSDIFSVKSFRYLPTAGTTGKLSLPFSDIDCTAKK